MEERKIFDVDINVDEEVCEDTLKELSNGKGDDENE